MEDEAFGRADHAAYLPVIADPAVRQAAGRKLLAVAQASTSPDAWTPELIDALDCLPDAEILPALRPKASDPRLRDNIAVILAHRNQAEDRPHLLAAMESGNPRVVEECAKALARSQGSGADDLVPLIKALSRHEQSKPATIALISLLTQWSHHAIPIAQNEKKITAFEPWFNWFKQAHPQQAGRLADFGPVDAASWQKRLAGVSWAAGDSNRGRTVFQQRSCAACHEGARRLGPELRGVGQRFSREDYFAQIINPSASIAPTYQALQITTRDGAVHVGTPVYQSPDSTILQVGIDATVRITGDQVVSTEPARRSPMPEGLLTGLCDAELADLYAYLQSLK